jgi:hypothetical protein
MAITKNSQIDLNGNEMILDADADTKIDAATDDEIHFTVAGSETVYMGVTSYNASDRIVLTNTGGNASATIVGSTSGESSVFMADGTSGDASYRGYVQYQHTNDNMNFGTAGSERARFDASGNLLLGTTTAEQDSGAGVKIRKDAGNGRCYLVGASDSGEGFSMHNGSVFRFFVGYNGTVNATNTSISGISDGRLKENIRDLDKGLEDILKLKPRKFDWKEGEGTDKKNVSGFIAQEAEEAGFEEFVGGWKHDELPDAKSFAQGGLIPALVKAIQEQQTIIEDLKTRIETLEGS